MSGNKNKAKGTRAETAVVKFITNAGFFAERKALSGSKDQGDVRAVFNAGVEAMFEVKAGKQTQNYSRKLKEEWLRQTRSEMANCSNTVVGYLVIAKYGHSVKDYEVWSSNGQVFFYLDELVQAYVLERDSMEEEKEFYHEQYQALAGHNGPAS